MDYNCTFINGTHFNSTEPCDYENRTEDLQILIFFVFTVGILCFICCPRENRHISTGIRLGIRRQHIIREIEPNYSDFIISLDEQLEDSICVICFEELEEEVVRLENCEHKFHKKCIKTWLKEKPICPICRTEIY